MGRHRIPPRMHGRDSWQTPTGYTYESPSWAKLERSDRRFHIGIRTYMVAATLAAAAISLGWIDLTSPAGTPDASAASDATAPRASINPASGFEASAGQPFTAQ